MKLRKYITDGGYNIQRRRSKSIFDIPCSCKGFLSDDPSATRPTPTVGPGKANMSLNTRECLVNVDRKTLNNMFSTWVVTKLLC